jgi:hypothetical protein
MSCYIKKRTQSAKKENPLPQKSTAGKRKKKTCTRSGDDDDLIRAIDDARKLKEQIKQLRENVVSLNKENHELRDKLNTLETEQNGVTLWNLAGGYHFPDYTGSLLTPSVVNGENASDPFLNDVLDIRDVTKRKKTEDGLQLEKQCSV